MHSDNEGMGSGDFQPFGGFVGGLVARFGVEHRLFDVGVAHELHDGFERNPLLSEQGAVGVPQVVEANPLDARLFRRPLSQSQQPHPATAPIVLSEHEVGRPGAVEPLQESLDGLVHRDVALTRLRLPLILTGLDLPVGLPPILNDLLLADVNQPFLEAHV